MYIHALTTEFEESNSETKFFIVKLLQTFTVQEDVNVNIKDLSKKLGVTVRVATKSIEYLVSKGYLKIQRYSDKKGGFPNGYQFQRSLTEHLNKTPLIPVPENIKHKSLIDDLLAPDVNKKKLQKRHPLHTSNRLLLSVLLAYADECGVVRSLGVSDISRMTGMSKDRFRSQLEKLKDLGYIRSHISGVTGSYLFGIVNSAYFLNLKHPNFDINTKAGVTIICSNVNRTDFIRPNESNQLFSLIKFARNRRSSYKKDHAIDIICLTLKHHHSVSCNELLLEIVVFLKHERKREVIKYLQLKLEEYASLLLSTCLKELPETGDFENEDLMSKIKEEMLSPQLSRSSFKGERPTKEQEIQFFDFIYYISLALAQSVKCFFNSVSLPHNLESMSHIILPSPIEKTSRSAISIESFYKQQPSTLPGSDCCFVFEPKYGPPKHPDDSLIEGIIEADIPDNDKYQYGLLTKPKIMPDSWPPPKSKKGRQVKDQIDISSSTLE